MTADLATMAATARPAARPTGDRTVDIERTASARLDPTARLAGRSQPSLRETAAHDRPDRSRARPTGESDGQARAAGEAPRPDGSNPSAEAEFGFWDFVDIINPLQHIPVVNHVYRQITGDEIQAPARVFGGALFGGPLGLIAAIGDTVFEAVSGGTVGEHAVAMVTGEPVTPPGGEPGTAPPGGEPGTTPDASPARELAEAPARPAETAAAANGLPTPPPAAPGTETASAASAAATLAANGAAATTRPAGEAVGAAPALAGGRPIAASGGPARFFDLADAPRRGSAPPAMPHQGTEPLAISGGLDAALTRLAAGSGPPPARASEESAENGGDNNEDGAPRGDRTEAAEASDRARPARPGDPLAPPADIPRAMAEALARYNQAAAIPAGRGVGGAS
ncbi:MAG: hypothetical protein RID91_09675 [Azospirillaceae bacterium]